MDEVIVKRFALDNQGELIEEETTYRRGPEGIGEVDSRYHALEGQEGEWLAISLVNFLGEITSYDPKTSVDKQPLREGITLTTEAFAIARKAERKAALDNYQRPGVSTNPEEPQVSPGVTVTTVTS